MAKENIDSWKWVTYFELTFGMDFGKEELFQVNVNEHNTLKKHESTRCTKGLVSLPNEEMHTILAKNPSKNTQWKQTEEQLACDNIWTKVEAMQHLK